MKHFFIRVSHFLSNDTTSLQAASLSFFTIFAIIPSLQIMIYLFNEINVLSNLLTSDTNFIFSILIPTGQEMVKTYLSSFLANTEKMGAVGVIYIIITSILFYFNYDQILKSIFKPSNYKLKHMVINYFTLMMVTPLLLVSTLLLTPQVSSALSIVGLDNVVRSDVMTVFFLTYVLFFINFAITPQSGIKIRHILLSSLVATLSWEVAKVLFIYYVKLNSTYITLYGSMSVVLLFFLWVYISWIIFLYGIKWMHYLHIIDSRKKGR
jgi:membrane protein